MDFFGVEVLFGDVVAIMMVVASPFVIVADLFEVDRVSSSEDVESYLTRLFFLKLLNSRRLCDRFTRFID